MLLLGPQDFERRTGEERIALDDVSRNICSRDDERSAASNQPPRAWAPDAMHDHAHRVLRACARS